MKIIFIILFCLNISSPSSDIEDNLRMQFNEMCKFYISKNFTDYSNFVHPNIVQYAGGKSAFVIKVSKFHKAIEDTGRRYSKIEIKSIKNIVKEGEFLQCLFEINLVVFDLGEYKTITHEFIGIAHYIDQKWYFINAQDGEEKIRSLFPDISPNLKISKRDKSKLIILHLLPDGLILSTAIPKAKF
jgi:hypothetical protein